MIRCPHCSGLIDLPSSPTPSKGAPLTKRQFEIYAYLCEFTASHGYAPNFDEIATQFGYGSHATVHEHLTSLERKGYIRRTYNESRAIECLVALDLVREPTAFVPNPSGTQSAEGSR
jgi:SOS-response transcriptional repressor LexA